jgi:hypothetical protein
MENSNSSEMLRRMVLKFLVRLCKGSNQVPDAIYVSPISMKSTLRGLIGGQGYIQKGQYTVNGSAIIVAIKLPNTDYDVLREQVNKASSK